MTASNADQIAYWNATAGATWTEYGPLLDRQLAPLGEAAIRVLAPAAGERILDIGCGCGDTTLALAARVAPGGAVRGVDISVPMLDAARARVVPAGASVDFREADAQTADLGAGAFNAVYSRFGVMFFNDPVAAFANIRRALRADGRLVFVCWRPLAENAWMREPLEAAAPFLPPPSPANPFGPGPFAFADPVRVCGILRAAGLTAATAVPFDTAIGGFGPEDALRLALRVGPLGAVLRENPALRPPVTDAVRGVLARYATADGVRMPAAVWIFSAAVG